MVKRIVLAAVAIAILVVALLALKRAFAGEEHRIRERCRHLATILTIPPGEKLIPATLRSERLRNLLDETVTFNVTTYRLSEDLSRDEIASRYLGLRRTFRAVEVLFRDIQVLSIEGGEATVVFTARATATSQANTRETRTAPVWCRLRKVDGKWLFSAFEERRVLEK